MTRITAGWLNDLLAGEEVRRVIQSQSPDKARKTISILKNLLADVSPDTKPLSALDKYFRQHKKPLCIIRSKTGSAPAGTRWICVLCPNQKQIKTRTNDLRRHLEKDHFCEKSELNKVFDPKDENRLWEHFGPCTEAQASDNGWEVGSYETRRKKAKLAMTALSEVTVPVKKGIHYVETFGKRKKSATSDSELDSGLESSTQLMKSLNLTSDSITPQEATDTDINGPTLVPHRTASSVAETSRSLPLEVYYSPKMYPADPPGEFMAQDPSTDLLGFSGQFPVNQSGVDPGTLQMADLDLPEFGDMVRNYFAQPYDSNLPVSISNPTMIDQIEIPMVCNLPTAPTQIDHDFHNWDIVDVDEFERKSFPIFFDQGPQQLQSNS